MTKANQTPAEISVAQDIAVRAKRAVETGRPAFLIVYYEHEAVKLAFIKSLQLAVKDVGLTTQTFDPAQRAEHGTGLLYPLLASAAREKILALIAGLPRMPGQSILDSLFLEYLNLHRDQISRDKLRFVLFLHTTDANQFIEGAGDLWDFRQHTYWLEGKPEASKTPLGQFSKNDVWEIEVSDESRADIADHVENVRSLIAQTANLEEKTQLYLDLARWLRRRHQALLSANVALEGLDILPTSDSFLHAELELELGNALKKVGNLSDAFSHYQHALRISRKISNRPGEAVTLNNISQIYKAWGRYDEALQKLEESLAIRREIGDRSGEVVTLNNISQIDYAWGRHEESLQKLEESLAISRENRNRSGEAAILNNISQIYKVWGRHDESLLKLEESQALYRKIGDRFGEAGILNNISQIYDGWGRYEESLQKLEESLAIYREIGDRRGVAVTLNNISQIYNAWGRYEESMQKLEESLTIYREIGDRSGEAVTCWNLALEFEHRGDLQNAIKFARCTVEIEEETKHPDLEKERSHLKLLEETLQKLSGNPHSPPLRGEG